VSLSYELVVFAAAMLITRGLFIHLERRKQQWFPEIQLLASDEEREELWAEGGGTHGGSRR